MTRLLLVAVVLAGCSKTRVKACDDLVALAEKIETCQRVPPEGRKSITRGVEQIRNALKMLEDVGDQAPKEQLEQLGQTCQRERDRIREMYEKVAPECVK